MNKDNDWLKTFQAACSAGWLSSRPLSCELESKLAAIEMMIELMIELLMEDLMMGELMMEELMMEEGVAAVALMWTLASR